MKYRHTRVRGFTLIEILIVVTIIGMLASIVFTTISSSRAKANDSKIISETIQYRTAFNIANNGTLPDPGSGSTYYCLDRSAGQSCQFWGTSYTASAAVASAMQGVIPSNATTRPISIDGSTFDAIVYKCMPPYNSGTCNAAIYWVQSSNTACTGGILVYQGSGGSVCGSNAADSGTNYVEAPPATFNQPPPSCGHPPCVSPSQ